MTPILLSFPDDRALAAAVAARIGAHLGRLEWRHFPDGESLVAIDPGVAGADVVLFASLNDPDRKALPLRFAARTARELGARSVGLVAPYLAYMRQDARFRPGEAVAAHAFAQFLDESMDWLVTVAPHLHRIATLDAVFRMPAVAVETARPLAEWIQREVDRPVLIGPDSESAQWVAEVAAHAQVPYEVLRKRRRGDREVEVSLPAGASLRGRTPVLVDDIASSGRTLAAALAHLNGLHLPPPVCVVIHAIFAGDAWDCLVRAGAGRIVSTDSIAHPSNAISLAAPIASIVAQRLALCGGDDRN
ncbi:ribose-phosphate diphosphokinase [Marilutibacter spongiae]|uniref:Ribose-phosphate diphosphokinase n=1 Tax=Marilutibacter spongiae TaxID=2025720 RepID=A0A7W3Y6U3_9GAMM|nr:ribose-phosphate diphosphokinase [Lysobacter spongiae]MBB1061469.1 ribose-phosphate diphosphokinase [Lysobacter spongiae]